MAMLKRVVQILRRLSPLAPWRFLRTLDEIRELSALRTQVKQGLKETKRLKKQVTELQRRLDAQAKQTRDEPKELAELRTRVEQARAIYKSDIRFTRKLDRALQQIGDAPPETDRYIYQVQLGPECAVREALTARLPADHAQRLVRKETTFKYSDMVAAASGAQEHEPR